MFQARETGFSNVHLRLVIECYEYQPILFLHFYVFAVVVSEADLHLLTIASINLRYPYSHVY